MRTEYCQTSYVVRRSCLLKSCMFAQKMLPNVVRCQSFSCSEVLCVFLQGTLPKNVRGGDVDHGAGVFEVSLTQSQRSKHSIFTPKNDGRLQAIIEDDWESRNYAEAEKRPSLIVSDAASANMGADGVNGCEMLGGAVGQDESEKRRVVYGAVSVAVEQGGDEVGIANVFVEQDGVGNDVGNISAEKDGVGDGHNLVCERSIIPIEVNPFPA